MRAEDVRMCIRHGAAIAGFVVDYPRPVPWNLSAKAAKELMPAVSKPAETCIVTGGRPEQILRLASALQPDYVQLHGGETLADTQRLVNELGKHSIKVIKTLFPGTPDLIKNAADFCSTGIYALLLDPRMPEHADRGGVADLSAFIRLRRAVSRPVILAGGITPENVAEIIRKTQAGIIDLMTGVERCHGIKDEAKVISLFKAIGRDNHPY